MTIVGNSNNTFLQMTYVILIMMCDATSQEAYRTITICYRLAEQRKRNSTERSVFLDLARTVFNYKPQFTAADIVVINRELILTTLGLTTTYLIINIQSRRFPNLC